MSSAGLPISARQRLLNSFRTGRALQIGAAALVGLAILIVLAVLYGDIPEFVHTGSRTLREFMRQNSFLPGFALLYLEESGVPLPAPGDDEQLALIKLAVAERPSGTTITAGTGSVPDSPTPFMPTKATNEVITSVAPSTMRL